MDRSCEVFYASNICPDQIVCNLQLVCSLVINFHSLMGSNNQCSSTSISRRDYQSIGNTLLDENGNLCLKEYCWEKIKEYCAKGKVVDTINLIPVCAHNIILSL